MNIGMLWFDNDPKTTLTDKVQSAAAYYEKKYGQKPTRCIVHKKMMEADKMKVDGITIDTHKSILPHHLWIGMKDTKSWKPPRIVKKGEEIDFSFVNGQVQVKR